MMYHGLHQLLRRLHKYHHPDGSVLLWTRENSSKSTGKSQIGHMRHGACKSRYKVPRDWFVAGGEHPAFEGTDTQYQGGEWGLKGPDEKGVVEHLVVELPETSSGKGGGLEVIDGICTVEV